MNTMLSAPSFGTSFPETEHDFSPRPVLFLFLEVFAQEGGIQSYIQDVLTTYGQLKATAGGDVFLLRDRPSDVPLNPIRGLAFRCFAPAKPAIGRLRLAIALFLYLLTQRPQHVFCGHILLAPLVQILCSWFRVPYTVLTYGKEVWCSLPKTQRQALQRANAIWTISRYTRDRLCVANDIDRDHVCLLPCTIDSTHFTPGEKSTELLGRYGLRDDAKTLVTVARLWSGDIYKGVDVTIRALPTIRQHYPNIQYVVVGRGDDQPRLAQLARDLGVETHVVFAGFVPTEDLRAHYRLADLYVMPSQEGFGIVYLEAMACGVPVLSGDRDGSAEPLQDGRLGWRVPHRDPAAVAASCIEALNGQDQRCDNAWIRQEVVTAFSAEAFQNRLQALINASLA